MQFRREEYLKSIKLLSKQLENSIIDFEIRYLDTEQNIVELSYPQKNDTLAKFYEIELQRICFETEFYKYITNEGSDFGKISSDKSLIPRRSYTYIMNEEQIIWEDFENEYENFKNNLKDIVNNIE
jgi:hypothetical protein